MVSPRVLWSFLLVWWVVTGCATPGVHPPFTPDEQSLHRIYSHIMTHDHMRTYRTFPTAEARARFAREVGAAQELAFLSAQEQESVRQGFAFVGMSRKAVRLLWGMPCREKGPPVDERWCYYGDALSLSGVGHHCTPTHTVTQVVFAHDKLQWWRERPVERSDFRLVLPTC